MCWFPCRQGWLNKALSLDMGYGLDTLGLGGCLDGEGQGDSVE